LKWIWRDWTQFWFVPLLTNRYVSSTDSIPSQQSMFPAVWEPSVPYLGETRINLSHSLFPLPYPIWS
jgi:hypothetical protein